MSAMTVEESDRDVAKHHAEWNSQRRSRVDRLCEGAVGRARSFDLAGYIAARDNAMTILNSALWGGEHTELFKVTESYRPGAEGRAKTEQLLRTLYLLLRDLMFVSSGAPDLVRNTDIKPALNKLAESASFEWIAFASERLAEVERGMRRNLLRSLSLDAFAAALA